MNTTTFNMLDEWRVTDLLRSIYDIVDEVVVNGGQPDQEQMQCLRIYFGDLTEVTEMSPARIVSFVNRRWDEGSSYRVVAAELLDQADIDRI